MTILDSHRHYSADADAFRQELVGQVIRRVEHDRIVLDDGVQLVIKDGGDCCAFFEGWFETVGDPEEAVVTRVDEVHNPSTEDSSDVNFTINIYAAHRQIVKAEVRGNAGTGYYGSSITLVVQKEIG